jgi:hypothetical protein
VKTGRLPAGIPRLAVAKGDPSLHLASQHQRLSMVPGHTHRLLTNERSRTAASICHRSELDCVALWRRFSVPSVDNLRYWSTAQGGWF